MKLGLICDTTGEDRDERAVEAVNSADGIHRVADLHTITNMGEVDKVGCDGGKVVNLAGLIDKLGDMAEGGEGGLTLVEGWRWSRGEEMRPLVIADALN